MYHVQLYNETFWNTGQLDRLLIATEMPERSFEWNTLLTTTEADRFPEGQHFCCSSKK